MHESNAKSEIKTYKRRHKQGSTGSMGHCNSFKANAYVKYILLMATHPNTHIYSMQGITYERRVVKEAISHSWKEGEEGIFETHLRTG